MPFIILMFLLSLASFSAEDCVETTSDVAKVLTALNCPETISRDEFVKDCSQKLKNFGGLKKVQCDSGKYKDCCYQKVSGSTWSKFKLIKCTVTQTDLSRQNP